MLRTIHGQIGEIRRHAEENCRKILTPGDDYSPRLVFWYDRIHAYKWLIRIKEEPDRNWDVSHAIRFAHRCKIENPQQLTLTELEEGLQLIKAMKKTVRGQAKGPRKVHLCDCLIKKR